MSQPIVLCPKCFAPVTVENREDGRIFALCEKGHVTTDVTALRESVPCIGCGADFIAPLGTIWVLCQEDRETHENPNGALAKLDAEYPDPIIARQVRDSIAAKAREKREENALAREDAASRELAVTVAKNHVAHVERAKNELAGELPPSAPPEDAAIVEKRRVAAENHAKRIRLAAIEGAAIKEGRKLTLKDLPEDLHLVATQTGVVQG